MVTDTGHGYRLINYGESLLPSHLLRKHLNTVGSHFATGRFTTNHFYDPCRVGPSTPDLWCIAVTTQASFLYLVRFWLVSGVHVFLPIPF